MDRRISIDDRRSRCDPQDGPARAASARLRARSGGLPAAMAALEDRRLWNETATALQDLAIDEVAARLTPAFRLLDTRIYRCGQDRHRLAGFRHEATGAALRLLPGGDFILGDASRRYESPPRRVRVRPFLIGVAPLTRASWARDRARGPEGELPMNQVSRAKCLAWLEAAGGGLRLPAEREWEYAARAGSQTAFFWGDDFDGAYCWARGNSGRQPREPREHLEAERWNAFGLVDVAGNLWEWCADDWSEGYQLSRGAEVFHADGSAAVRRGGSWASGGHCARSAARHWRPHSYAGADTGLRLARSLDELAP